MAIALGAIFGLEVIVTAGSDDKCAAAVALGAARLLRELGSRLVPAWERREVRAMVDRTFSIEEADAAHAYLASNKTFGALVLRGF